MGMEELKRLQRLLGILVDEWEHIDHAGVNIRLNRLIFTIEDRINELQQAEIRPRTASPRDDAVQHKRVRLPAPKASGSDRGYGEEHTGSPSASK